MLKGDQRNKSVFNVVIGSGRKLKVLKVLLQVGVFPLVLAVFTQFFIAKCLGIGLRNLFSLAFISEESVENVSEDSDYGEDEGDDDVNCSGDGGDVDDDDDDDNDDDDDGDDDDDNDDDGDVSDGDGHENDDNQQGEDDERSSITECGSGDKNGHSQYKDNFEIQSDEVAAHRQAGKLRGVLRTNRPRSKVTKTARVKFLN